MQTQNVLNIAKKNRVHCPRRPNANKLKTVTKYNQIHHDSDKIITYIHHNQKSKFTVEFPCLSKSTSAVALLSP